MSDPIRDLQSRIDQLWKELTQMQAAPQFNLRPIQIPLTNDQPIFLPNEKYAGTLSPHVVTVIDAGKLNPDGTITNNQGGTSITINLDQPGTGRILLEDGNVLKPGGGFGYKRLTAAATTGDQNAAADPLGGLVVSAHMYGVNAIGTMKRPLVDAGNRLSNHPYDRNPVFVDKTFELTGVAPHGTTQRWQYTVPAGKKAIVSSWFARHNRVTAGAPNSTSFVIITTVGSRVVYLRAVLSGTGSVDSQWASGGWGSIMTAGDTLTAFTGDASTGGTIDYNADTRILEFDA